MQRVWVALQSVWVVVGWFCGLGNFEFLLAAFWKNSKVSRMYLLWVWPGEFEGLDRMWRGLQR